MRRGWILDLSKPLGDLTRRRRSIAEPFIDQPQLIADISAGVRIEQRWSELPARTDMIAARLQNAPQPIVPEGHAGSRLNRTREQRKVVAPEALQGKEQRRRGSHCHRSRPGPHRFGPLLASAREPHRKIGRNHAPAE